MPPSKTSWTLPEQFDEYRLIRMLGRGNMGVVFLGHDLVLDRPVAIKFLNNVDADPRARERFLTEARAAARIHHPNVMAIYRVGELEGRLYIIGEYIRGLSLSEIPRPITWQAALKIGVGLARGLACAHRQGVLHRDIKLANAMQGENGEVKLLDFSLAKLLEGASPVDDVQVTPSVPSELESTLDPAIQIDPGARAGRLVDASLHASPRTGEKISDMGSTMSKADPQAIQRMRRSDSSDGVVVGTPFYMAPELWRAVPASRTTDVYALGVALYILCSNHPPIDGRSTLELARLSQEQRPKPLRALAPTVDPRFAEIVDRCLRPASEDRYTSGDELCAELELLASEGTRESTAVIHGNPYRGLQAFEARHRAVFFGRSAEIRAVTTRLRAEPFLLVAGDSGVGKSSLCRAGVLPSFSEHATDGRAWSTLSLMPGRRPLQTLVSALATPLKANEEFLRELFESDPGELIRMMVRQQGKTHGLVLFIDQLEELVTMAEPVQRIVVGRFLAEVASGLPGIRLLATARGDFLTRVAALPEIGSYINAAIYLLTPLTPEGVRDAIVGPARLQGVNFESEELIETLGTAGVEGNLPLLQFALAELWEARDPTTKRITAADLERIGRVTGALTRHADNVVASLPASQRVAVRRLLMRLVTIEDTRASLPLEDLVLGDSNNETALEALVRGRLVVAREAQDGTVYEIAHEALIRNWDTLQRWITDERETRETYHRLEIAAAEWQRLGGGRIGLWTVDQLAEADRLDRGNQRPRELEFLAASRADVRRVRRLKWLAIGSVPTLLLLIFIGFRVQQARELASQVKDRLTTARATLAQAHTTQDQVLALRQQAFQEFDAPDLEAAEKTWTAARAATAVADRELRRSIQEFELALTLDSSSQPSRRGLGEALLARALALESSRRQELAAELIERLETMGDAELLARWNEPGKLSLRTDPPVQVKLERYQQDPETQRYLLTDPQELGTTPLVDVTLPQGSYLLHLAGPAPIDYPLVVRRGEARSLDIALPRPEDIPNGFVYIPEGRFEFGSGDDEAIRRFFIAIPQHEVTTPAYLIARNETTIGEWIEFLETLPPAERSEHLAVPDGMFVGVKLAQEDGTWTFTISHGDSLFKARRGEPIVYTGRKTNASQDWLRMPASNLNRKDLDAYLAWLGRTGKVPGARMCDEREWERAARGADSRNYPHGDRLEPEDAHVDVTYGLAPGTVGPDQVGMHPASRSPFGLDDTAGNVGEWVLSVLVPDERVSRSGSYPYDAGIARLVNRVPFSGEIREPSTGLRVCATPRTRVKP